MIDPGARSWSLFYVFYFVFFIFFKFVLKVQKLKKLKKQWFFILIFNFSLVFFEILFLEFWIFIFSNYTLGKIEILGKSCKNSKNYLRKLKNPTLQ